MRTDAKMFPWSLAVLVLAVGLGGCGKQKADPPAAAAADAPRRDAPVPATKQEVPTGDADLLQNVAVGTAATNKTFLEGDRAWQELSLAMRPPAPPPEWETNQPSKEAIAEFQKKTGALALQIAEKAKDFYTKFPQHEMAPEARDRERYLLGVAVQSGATNAQPRLQALEEAKLKDPDLPEEERLQLRIGQLQRAAANAPEGDSSARLTTLEKGVRALIKEFPQRAELLGLLGSLADGWVEAGQLDKAKALATEVAEGKGPQEAKDEALGLLKKINRVGKPLGIKFKAVDGRDVDLASLKGKVVLVDFWATWCGPCMAELPDVKAAHEKLHEKGFEIVGISLDQEKQALQKVLEAQHMTWPQFFDESGEGNKVADEFEVASIPTMWLVDKKGNLRELNGREDLAAKVEKLLAE